eukprot:17578_1
MAKEEWKEQMKMQIYFKYDSSQKRLPSSESVHVSSAPRVRIRLHMEDELEMIPSEFISFVGTDGYGDESGGDSIATKAGYRIIELSSLQFSVFAPHQNINDDEPYISVHDHLRVSMYGKYAFNVSQPPAIIHLDDGTLIVMDGNAREYVTSTADSAGAVAGLKVVIDESDDWSYTYEDNETYYPTYYCLHLFETRLDPNTYFD